MFASEVVCQNIWQKYLGLYQGILKGNRVSLWPLCKRYGTVAILTVMYICMEVGYCAFRFGTIIRTNLLILSLPRDSLQDNPHVNECVI